MAFHTTPQFHATISHRTLFFTTPFCTTSHSVVHPGHGHSTSYNIPFRVTNIYLPSVVSFNSALNTHLFSSDYFACVREVCYWFDACVCSGRIPHHKCCSVYVISRVKIALHYSTPYHIKRFHIAHHSIT